MTQSNLFINTTKDNLFLPLPNWMKYFLKLGNLIGNYCVSKKNNLKVFIILPTRSFATSLISFGIMEVMARNVEDQSELYQHIEKLKELPLDSHIRYQPGKKSQHAKWGGVRSDGRLCIRLQTRNSMNSSSNLKAIINPEKALDIIILKDNITDEKPLPKNPTVLINPKVTQKTFLDVVLKGVETKFYTQNITQKIVIIGNKSQIYREIQPSHFSVKNGDIYLNGSLQELILEENLSKDRYNKYATKLLINDGEESETISRDSEDTEVVCFDSAMSFIRWRDYWYEKNWVVILDRTDTHFTEAVICANNILMENQIFNEEISSIGIDIPKGIEIAITYD